MPTNAQNIFAIAAIESMVLLQGEWGVQVCGVDETHECAGSIFRVIIAQKQRPRCYYMNVGGSRFFSQKSGRIISADLQLSC